MARIHVPYPISGSMGGLVFYPRKDGKDKTFVRTKADPAPGGSLEPHSIEMKGRAAMAVDLRRVLHPLAPLRTGNWQSALSGALCPVQKRDTDGAYGERAVLLSRHGALLTGFSLNKYLSLEALVRSPLDYGLNRAAGSATLGLPELVAGANWQLPGPQSWFRWVAVLGAVPDQLFVAGQGYTPAGNYHPVFAGAVYGDWHPVKGGAPATTMHLALPAPPPTTAYGLVLAAGIVLGAVNGQGQVEPVGYAGAGKIVAVE